MVDEKNIGTYVDMRKYCHHISPMLLKYNTPEKKPLETSA